MSFIELSNERNAEASTDGIKVALGASLRYKISRVACYDCAEKIALGVSLSYKVKMECSATGAQERCH